MTMNEKFANRFKELADQFSSLPVQVGAIQQRFYADSRWRQWATSAQSLIRAAFGEHSPHYENFVARYKICTGDYGHVGDLRAVFESAKADFEGGYIFDVELRVSGEVFGDFVRLAREALTEGHHHVAAVLASAALEDALKRFASANGLEVTGKDMQNVVNALKGAGLVSGAQKTLLDAMPKLRNAALHAEWDRLTESEVGSILGYAEQFLLAKFSE